MIKKNTSDWSTVPRLTPQSSVPLDSTPIKAPSNTSGPPESPELKKKKKKHKTMKGRGKRPLYQVFPFCPFSSIPLVQSTLGSRVGHRSSGVLTVFAHGLVSAPGTSGPSVSPYPTARVREPSGGADVARGIGAISSLLTTTNNKQIAHHSSLQQCYHERGEDRTIMAMSCLVSPDAA